MKALFKDYSKLKTTVISSLYETSQYPAQNVANVFLNKWYISVFALDTLTVDLGSEMTMNSIFIAGCNADKFSIVAKDADGLTVFSITDKPNLKAITPVYFDDDLQVRSIEITADVSSGIAPFLDPLIEMGTNLKIKGVGCGNAINITGDLLNGFSLPQIMNTRFSSSQGGQYTSSQYEPLRERSWTFDNVEWDDLKTLEDAILYLGYKNPTFFDTFEDAVDYDPPMYMVIDDVIQPQRVRGDLYNFTLKMKEAR